MPSSHYSRSLYARPEIWSGRPLDSPERFLTGVRAADVRFPAAKVFLFDGEAPLRVPPGQPVGKVLQAFVDGHAVRRLRADASEPVTPATNDVGDPSRLHDTKDGSHGLDYP